MSEGLDFLRHFKAEDTTRIIRELMNRVGALERAAFHGYRGLDNPYLHVAVPASGVTFPWPGPGVATVYIYGGLLTNVTIVGQFDALFLPVTGGTFRLVPGDTIQLTYTLAPSWGWTVD